MNDAVAKLTIDPSKTLDHKESLNMMAKKLEQFRNIKCEELAPGGLDLIKLKESIQVCQSESDVVKALRPHSSLLVASYCHSVKKFIICTNMP